ncbi:MAG TPA: GNAT family N-acetyltransferase [Iamia sp.]
MTDRRPTLEVLADSGPGVGSGHLARSLAVAATWAGRGGRAVLRDAPASPGPWSDRYAAAGVEVGGEPGAEDSAGPGRVVLVDGYRQPAGRIAALRTGAPVVSIDDHGASGPRPADLVVDQNPGADPDGYRAAGAERVLVGSRYALLRPEVVAAAPVDPPDRGAPPRRLLVAAGGDPHPGVARLLDEVAAGAAGRHGLEVVALRGVADVGAVLATVDLALTAAGSTLWELARFGIPSVAVAVAPNQQPVARAVGTAGLAVDAGDLADVDTDGLGAALDALVADADRRAEMARRGREAVDGHGARRVAAAARALLVRLRRAGPGDADLLWRWRNDPHVRAASFDPDPIPWDDHVAWLDRVLAAPDAAIWIATDQQDRPLGQVRVEGAATGTGTTAVVVAPEARGEGWAAPVLAAAAEAAGRELGPAGLVALRAEVVEDNARSAAAFVAADFDRGPDGARRGRAHRTYHRPGHV